MGGKDRLAWLFSVVSGKPLTIFTGHSDEITKGTFINDYKSVLTASLDGKIKVWNPKSGALKFTI